MHTGSMPQVIFNHIFLKHIVYIDDVPVEHLLAFAEWCLLADDIIRSVSRKLVDLWRADLNKLVGQSSFIPAQRIKSKFVHIPLKKQCQNLKGYLKLINIYRSSRNSVKRLYKVFSPLMNIFEVLSFYFVYKKHIQLSLTLFIG